MPLRRLRGCGDSAEGGQQSFGSPPGDVGPQMRPLSSRVLRTGPPRSPSQTRHSPLGYRYFRTRLGP